MQKAVFLISLILAFNLIGKGQNKSIKPSKDANVIVIQKKGNSFELLSDYALKLQDLGYIIKDINKELSSFHTDYKFYKYSSISTLRLKVVAKQEGENAVLDIRGEVMVYGEYGNPVPYEACYCGKASGTKKAAFNEMLKTVEGLDYSGIEFLEK